MTRVKKKDILKAQYDRKQAMLDPTRRTGTKKREDDIILRQIEPVSQFICPFCLYRGHLWKFAVKTKKGYSQKRAKCPECKEGMMMRTLRMKVTPEEFADWCYQYGKGFWQKVSNFEQWNNRLRKIKWSWRFWKKYKELKGEFKEESYADKMNREAEEWMEKQKNAEKNIRR